MEEASAKVQAAINKLIDDVDKSCLRKMQIEMFKCSTRCSEDMSMSIHQVQQCVSHCGTSSEKADQYLQTELQAFQSRLQRCAMDCRDKANDTLTASASESERQKASRGMDKCVVKCVDSHLALIPNLMNRIKQTISTMT